MAQNRLLSSLQSDLNPSSSFALTRSQGRKAKVLFDRLVQCYGLEQTVSKGYKPATILQETYNRAVSKDVLLKFFVAHIYEVCCETKDPDVDVEMDISIALSYVDNFIGNPRHDSSKMTNINGAVEELAEYMVDSFFLPLRVSSAKTAQVISNPSSSVPTDTATNTVTKENSSFKRQKCLARDSHRCVVSRKFDRAEAQKRIKREGDNCMDDDGKPLRNDTHGRFQFLDVAYIFPHSLTSLPPGETELSESKKKVFRILDIFSPGISQLLDMSKIDSPINSLTLTQEYHRVFGEFQICFEQTRTPHEYVIDSMEQRNSIWRDPLFPVTRILRSSCRDIDLPDPRLLSAHGAIAHIMHLSGVAKYIEKILQDIEEMEVKSDGSTNLGYLTGLRLDGWLDTLAVF